MMKLIELEIKNIRGIKELTLRPNGSNFVVWGTNGSGKSAVVDAIDFLLTGRITRLTGEGTGNITLQEHGAHVDCKDSSDSYVKMIVSAKGVDKPIELHRSMNEPGKLSFPSEMADVISPILEITPRGQHVLTRREILKFITAEGGKRAKDIQFLMNLREVESIRATLVKVNNKADSKARAAKLVLDKARNSLIATTGHLEYQPEAVLEYINKNRVILGGKPNIGLSSSTVKMDVLSPKVLAKEHDVNTTLFERDIKDLLNLIGENSREANKKQDEILRSRVDSLHQDAILLRSISTQKLVQDGLDLIDDTGNCPLCDSPWDPGELMKYMINKLGKADEVQERINQIEENASFLLERTNMAAEYLEKINAITKILDLDQEIKILAKWQTDLKNLTISLSDPVKRYHQIQYSIPEVSRLNSPMVSEELLSGILNIAQSQYPQSTPEQTAWDTLTLVESKFNDFEQASNENIASIKYQKRANSLAKDFVLARDQVLQKLYDEIKERFVELYRDLHHDDERNFNARLKPDEAALEFEVDFYGRGTHPPHALHSEGHQDSMGLCLFLALSEKLTGDLIDLIILDDVVMSVDADHRRDLCGVLSKHFQNKQFLITTHDRVWARQLRSEGLVKSNTLIEFYNWNLESGPKINDAVDMWSCIEADLEKQDIPAASARLRRGSEQFFAEVCDHLYAPVQYKLSNRYQLGDFIFPAMSEFKSLLKQANKAAKSWADNGEEIQVLDNKRKEIFTNYDYENWAVNINVHYNEWANFSLNDFRPVVEAYKNLQNLFLCQNCMGILYLTKANNDPDNVRCNCGAVNWNLVQKKKEN